MKKELLAPAGDMDSLKAAILNGADAIYLAGKSFGARKFAKNFTNEELEEAIRLAHLYDVKIYVTVNTIIYESELEECLKYLEFLYSIGADAVIMQDLGLIRLTRKLLPDLVIHASTQAHTHNLEQIKLLESLGVKRVVLARELSIEEINNLDTNMELEIFIHGALCISYSGQCLFSSGLLNRSGNRGECAGLCRTKFDLKSDDKTLIKNKYVISPKEFNTTDYVKELINSKAVSFKIEGRMKSPEYVGYVTSLYRRLLDGEIDHLSAEEIFNLKSLYNRSFTKGFLFHEKDEDLISLDYSNHQGVEIGQVIEVNKHKIKIKLSHRLNQEDGIRLPNNEGMIVNFLYNKDMLLVNHGDKNDIVYLDNKVNLKELGSLMLTTNKDLSNYLKEKQTRKIKIDCEIEAYLGKNIIVKYYDQNNTVKFVGDIVSEAKTMPLKEERIKEIFSKLGSTPFIVNNIKVNMSDNIFIPVGVLNEIRRNLIQELMTKKMGTKKSIKIDIPVKVDNKRVITKLKISALARCEEQIKALLKENVDYIYVTDPKLYQKYKGSNVYLRLDRVMDNHKPLKGENLLIGETGSLIYTKDNTVISDYYLNVVNHEYIDYLHELNVKRITLSPELTKDGINLLIKKIDSDIELEMLIYGRLEYMIMKYHILESYDKNPNYYLEDQFHNKFPIIDEKYAHIMSHKKLDYLEDICEYQNMGINTFRLELWDESEEEITTIINKIRKAR